MNRTILFMTVLLDRYRAGGPCVELFFDLDDVQRRRIPLSHSTRTSGDEGAPRVGSWCFYFRGAGYCKWILGFEGEAQAIERRERGPPFSKNEKGRPPRRSFADRWSALRVTHPPLFRRSGLERRHCQGRILCM